MNKTPWQYAETNTEYAHQVALFMWANMAERYGLWAADQKESYLTKGHAQIVLNIHLDSVLELHWLFAIKNAGHGDAIRGARSAAEGVKSGVPDICLPVTQYLNYTDLPKYAGLYIELKRPGAPKAESMGKKGVQSLAQIDWQAYLNDAGYKSVVAYGWLEARDEILKYLGKL